MFRKTQSHNGTAGFVSSKASGISSNHTPTEIREEMRKRTLAKHNATMQKLLCSCSVVLVIVLISPVLYVLCTRLGLGSLFPYQGEFIQAEPLLPDTALEIVAELPMPPGNIAVSSNGRIFFSFHPEFGPADIKVAELKTKTTYKAFPNEEFQNRLATCLSMRIDRQDRLWLLDFNHHGIKGDPVLYAFALKKRDILVKEIPLGTNLAGFGSMLNDFQVDPSGEFIYIADTGIVSTTPSLIVYSLKDDYGYRILDSHPSMYGQSTFINVGGSTVQYGPFGLTINVDSITLDRSGSKLYYGALTSDHLYSISTSHLLHYLRTSNESFTDQEILNIQMPQRVNLVLNNKPITDGITTDMNGNIYMTAIEHHSIAIAIPIKIKTEKLSFVSEKESFQLYKLIQNNELLRWPDGLCFGNDGLYITNSALHLKFTGQDYKHHTPYHILKISNTKLKQGLNEIVLSESSKKGINFVVPPAGH